MLLKKQGIVEIVCRSYFKAKYLLDPFCNFDDSAA